MHINVNAILLQYISNCGYSKARTFKSTGWPHIHIATLNFESITTLITIAGKLQSFKWQRIEVPTAAQDKSQTVHIYLGFITNLPIIRTNKITLMKASDPTVF